jgi:hypothetical protein
LPCIPSAGLVAVRLTGVGGSPVTRAIPAPCTCPAKAIAQRPPVHPALHPSHSRSSVPPNAILQRILADMTNGLHPETGKPGNALGLEPCQGPAACCSNFPTRRCVRVLPGAPPISDTPATVNRRHCSSLERGFAATGRQGTTLDREGKQIAAQRTHHGRTRQGRPFQGFSKDRVTTGLWSGMPAGTRAGQGMTAEDRIRQGRRGREGRLRAREGSAARRGGTPCFMDEIQRDD